MIALPDPLARVGVEVQPLADPPGHLLVTWPRDTLEAARGAIVVGLFALMALLAPMLWNRGYPLPAAINFVIGLVGAVVAYRVCWVRTSLEVGPGRLVLRRAWRGRRTLLPLDAGRPCTLVAARPERDAEGAVHAVDAAGRSRVLFRDDRWRAEVMAAWLNAVVAGGQAPPAAPGQPA